MAKRKIDREEVQDSDGTSFSNATLIELHGLGFLSEKGKEYLIDTLLAERNMVHERYEHRPVYRQPYGMPPPPPPPFTREEYQQLQQPPPKKVGFFKGLFGKV